MTPEPDSTPRVPPAATRTVHQRSENPVYAEIHASADFRELRDRYRRFAFPWTVAFLTWYLLYVVLSNWAHGFMSHRLVGHINVALVFGLLQFISTFAIAYLYSKHAARELDPLADKLKAEFDQAQGDATIGGRHR